MDEKNILGQLSSEIGDAAEKHDNKEKVMLKAEYALAENHEKPDVKKKFNWYRAAALASTCCFMLSIFSVFYFQGKSGTGVFKYDGSKNTSVTDFTAKDYDEIYKAIKSISANSANYGYGTAVLESGVMDGGAGVFASEKSAVRSIMDAAPHMTMGGGNDVSKTNTQVEGVDEADIVKNDGKYVYTIFCPTYYDYDNYNIAQSQQVKIISVENPQDMKVVASIRVITEEQAAQRAYVHVREMYVSGDRLIVMTASNTRQMAAQREFEEGKYKDKSDDYFYEYSNGISSESNILVYDISDRANPVLIRNFSQDGDYQSSRLIGDNLYTISVRHVFLGSKYDYKPEDVIPQYKDNLKSESFLLMAAGDICVPSNPSNSSYTIISGMDIKNSSNDVSLKSTLGSGGTVYSSKDNLYVATYSYSFSPRLLIAKIASFASDYSDAGMEVIKFGLDKGKVTVKQRTSVPGNVINQYSMDEYNGHFRIATTYINNKGLNENGVYVFDGEMSMTGKLDGMAPDERIYSVRYTGNKMYMVTFKQVDPLFVIDLSDPSAPKELGQLKIPGFSNYMHPYSDNLMIGIGMQASNEGRVQGMKLSLFDVSNPEDPKEISSYNIEENAYSDVQYNPKAFLFSKEKNLISFPMQYHKYFVHGKEISEDDLYSGKLEGTIDFNTESYETKFHAVFAIFGLEDNKLVKRAYVEQPQSGDQYDATIQRGCYVGDTLFTVSNNNILATSLKDFSKISDLKF